MRRGPTAKGLPGQGHGRWFSRLSRAKHRSIERLSLVLKLRSLRENDARSRFLLVTAPARPVQSFQDHEWRLRFVRVPSAAEEQGSSAVLGALKRYSV